MTGECVGHPARGPEEMEVPAGGTGACGTALNPDFSSFTFTELVIHRMAISAGHDRRGVE